MFLSFRKNKETKCIFVQISKKKKIKRPSFLCQKRADQELSKSIIRFLTILIWNLDKWKSQKLKNSIFDGPLIVNQTFSQIEHIFGKSDFAHTMYFHQT